MHTHLMCKENWCLRTVVLEKTLQSPLDSKEIKSVNPKGNEPWILLGRTDAEAPILWPLAVKSWLVGKDPDDGKDWRREEKGMAEDEMVGWHHWFNGHEFEQTPGDNEGQMSLACCSLWGHKESDMTEWLNWTELGSSCGSVGKEYACNVGDLGLIPGLGRCSREWKGYPLQYSRLENSTDCIVHGVAKSQTWLSDFT